MTDDLVTFSVIVPTRGRRSLRATLDSIAEQLEPGDEILVRCGDDGDFGNASRQSLLERARGTHLLFMDDDDQFARGAFATMRRFARDNPGRVGIFRMRLLDGTVLWKERAVRRANVSTQMYCVPNVAGKLGTWLGSPTLESTSGRRYDVADFDFIAGTIALQGEPVFREEIVAYLRADRRPLVRWVQRVLAPVRAVLTRLRARQPPGTRR